MIKKLVIDNYRCFYKCEIDFNALTILVGKNNAGKSTLIEVLRIVSIGVNRASSVRYETTPGWLDINQTVYGFSPSIENLDISTENIFYFYGSGPSRISTFFTNGSYMDIYIGENARIFVALFDSKNNNIRTKAAASELYLQGINILPQIGPIQRDENILKYSTVSKNINTRISSRNFRNQLKYYYEYFDKFRELSEATWHGLSLSDLENKNELDGKLLLMVSDNNFVAEIGWMGHGLQMWIQTMWFISRCEKSETVILDEPDVYMHADLQRRLIRFIKNKFNQIIIATHSVEIMAEVEPENILPVDSKKNRLEYAYKELIVQKIIDDIGSVHNLEITRLFSHKKFLIVEGDTDDIKILGILQSKLLESIQEPLDILPKIFVEGWGGWQRVIGSHKVFSENDTEIQTFCIFDRDYHTEDEIDARYTEARRLGLNLIIWSRKEIENFLIIPEAIKRIIEREGNTDISIASITKILDSIFDSFKVELIDDFATEFHSKNKALAVKSANQKARDYVESLWNKKIELIPGKKVISKLSEWSSKNYHVNISPFKLARELKKEEIPDEVTNAINFIERNALVKPSSL